MRPQQSVRFTHRTRDRTARPQVLDEASPARYSPPSGWGLGGPKNTGSCPGSHSTSGSGSVTPGHFPPAPITGSEAGTVHPSVPAPQQTHQKSSKWVVALSGPLGMYAPSSWVTPQTWASLWAEFFSDQGFVSTGQDGDSPHFPGGSMWFRGWIIPGLWFPEGQGSVSCVQLAGHHCGCGAFLPTVPGPDVTQPTWGRKAWSRAWHCHLWATGSPPNAAEEQKWAPS